MDGAVLQDDVASRRLPGRELPLERICLCGSHWAGSSEQVTEPRETAPSSDRRNDGVVGEGGAMTNPNCHSSERDGETPELGGIGPSWALSPQCDPASELGPRIGMTPSSSQERGPRTTSRSDPQLDIAYADCSQGTRAEDSGGYEVLRSAFERNARRYYYQLTVGCGNDACQNRLCRSCAKSIDVTPDAATILSIQLASGMRRFFCETPVPGCLQFDCVDRCQMSNLEATKTESLPNSFLHISFPSSTFASVLWDAQANDVEGSDSQQGVLHPQVLKSKQETRARIHHVCSGGAVSAGNSPVPPPRNVAPVQAGAGVFVSGLSASLFRRDSRFETLFGVFRSVDNPEQLPWSAKRSKSLFDLPSLSSASTFSSAQRLVGGLPVVENTVAGITEAVSLDAEGKGPDEVGMEVAELSAEVVCESAGTVDMKSGIVSQPVGISYRGSHQRKGHNFPTFCTLSRCCDRIRYLSIPRLKEAVGNYVAEVAMPTSVPENASIAQTTKSGDPTFLLDTIRDVFSSGEALAKSFLVDASADVSSVTSGLDLAAVRQAYGLILSLEPAPLFITTLTAALEILLARMEMNDRAISESRRALRQLLILLECPLLRGESYDNTILKRLVHIFGRLKRKPRSVLARWFSAYPVDFFGPVVLLFQGFLAEHYTADLRKEDSATYALKTLRLLYAANEANGRDPIIPISAFYNAKVCCSLNFKEEHRKWQRLRGRGRAKGQQALYFDYPFLFDLATKSHILHLDAMVQMIQHYEDACVRQAIDLQAQRVLPDRQSQQSDQSQCPAKPYLVFAVRRERFLEDALEQLETKEGDLKKPMKVRFIGGGEEGLDQGGLQKELFQLLMAKVLDPSYGMFTYDEETRYSWINSNSLEPEKRFAQVGIFLGLALYNGIILGVNFPRLFYKKLLNEPVILEDIKDTFPTLGRGLEQMLRWKDGDVYDVFMRSFELACDVHGLVKTIPLVDGGHLIPVTNDNREEYVRLYIKHLTHDAVDRQFRALKAGFLRVCGGMALQMCRPEELEVLLNGSQELDFEVLEGSATYVGGYYPEHALMRDFWSIVHELSLEQKKKLLVFVTASDRVPIQGLSKTTFVIQRNGPDSDRLPTALTCFGRLLLPEYSSREKLRNRLLTAVENAHGFGLI